MSPHASSKYKEETENGILLQYFETPCVVPDSDMIDHNRGSMFPCSQQNVPCVPLFPNSIFFFDFDVPCSLNTAFVPVFPALFSFCSPVPNNFKHEGARYDRAEGLSTSIKNHDETISLVEKSTGFLFCAYVFRLSGSFNFRIKFLFF